MLTDYTTYAEIRAVLGVSDKDLADTVLALPLYNQYINFELSDMDSTLQAQYVVIAAIAENSRTTAQQQFYERTRVFVAYSVSKHLLTSLPYFAVQMVTDGRAQAQRISDPYAETRDAIDNVYAVIKNRLLTSFNALGNTKVFGIARTHMVGVGIASDPVTA